MRRITIAVVLGLAALAWLGHVDRAFAGQKGHAHVPPAAHASKPTPSSKPAPFVARIERNPQLTSRLQPLLPSGVTLANAAEGFKTDGQFIAALHASHNLDIPFAQLKADMTGADHSTLGHAIHELRPTADAKDAVKTAEQQAKADLKATRSANDADKDAR